MTHACHPPVRVSLKDLVQEIRRLLSQPAEQIDPAQLLDLSGRLALQLLGAEPGRPRSEPARAGLIACVRALLEGQASHPRELANITLDPPSVERRCTRIQGLRAALTTLLGLCEGLRATLQAEEEALQQEAKRSYDLVRPLVQAYPHIAATLRPATDYFLGPALRAAQTRAVARRAAERARTELHHNRAPEPGVQPEPAAETPPQASVPPLPFRRRRR
ncbi:MAG: hypothetical protein RMK29_06655 [Myxococcales bacterium]|nr:hypothetical protein [Myxococcota bacterium]MDW8281374.1 hypothetical protein [Myxococcales bacterium]